MGKIYAGTAVLLPHELVMCLWCSSLGAGVWPEPRPVHQPETRPSIATRMAPCGLAHPAVGYSATMGRSSATLDMERVLNDLFVNEVLERERAGGGQYEYRFHADLFRLWVRQAHSVWEHGAFEHGETL